MKNTCHAHRRTRPIPPFSQWRDTKQLMNIQRQHGGPSVRENLCISCYRYFFVFWNCFSSLAFSFQKGSV